MHLLARVRDEDVGAPVAVIVSACDSHPRVRVGDPGRRRALLEAEPEAGRVSVRSSRPGDVLVQAIGIRVVGDVDVEIAVTLEVREQDAQPVSEVRHLEAGLRADLAERRVLVLPGALVQEQEIANAEVGLRKALGRLRERTVQVRISGDKEIGEAVTVHVPDGGAGVPAVDADPGRTGALGERAVAVVPEKHALAHGGDIDVRVTVEVEVSGNTPVPADGQVSARFGADVGELAFHVVEQGGARQASAVLPAVDLALGVRVHGEEVEPAVLVVVEPADPASQHGPRVRRDLPVKDALLEVQPDCMSYVRQLERVRRPLGRPRLALILRRAGQAARRDERRDNEDGPEPDQDSCSHAANPPAVRGRREPPDGVSRTRRLAPPRGERAR